MAVSSIGNIKVKPVKVVWNGQDLGFTEGDVAFSPEEQVAEVTAHQTGTQVLDVIKTGVSAEMTITLKETSKAQLEDMILRGRDKNAGTAEESLVTVAFSSLAAIDGKYFLLNSALNAVEYYVWFDLDTGGNDPAPAGKTAIQVSVSTGDSASVVAAALQSAIDALPAFSASVSGVDVTIVNAAVGATDDTVDVDTGFTFCTTVEGHGLVAVVGSSDLFLNASNYAAPMYLHPISLADSDASEDLYFPVAYPLLNSITYSGENTSTIEISFRVFPKLNADGTWYLYKFGER